MEISILNIITILILFQLVFVSLFLFTSKSGRRLSNRILGFFFLLLAFNIGDGIISMSGFYVQFPQMAHIEDGFVLLFGHVLFN